MQIGIMGLGTIGQTNRKYLESNGHTVYGYDPKIHSEFWLPDCDIYLICTPADNVIEACVALKEIDAAVISIESTVKVGTCRKAQKVSDALTFHCPQRYWKNDPYHRGVRRHRLLAAVEGAIGIGISFYRQMNIPVYPVHPVEVAELSKVMENAYRGVQIAFAQELKLKADRLGLDFNIVRESIMTASPMHWIAEAREGIGGSCLPMAMEWSKDNFVVNAAIEANRRYKEQ